MSLAGNQRRDQRRRLVVSWNRLSSTAANGSTAEVRQIADYSPEALPERQPALAMLLPTSLGGMALVSGGILSLISVSIGIGWCEPVFNASLFSTAEGRFSAAIAAAKACFDPHSLFSLTGWLGQMALVVAAIVSLVVRLMRRHRCDDYHGRYRAWGWLAALYLLTACAGHVPIGTLVGSILSDATGITLGPQGQGWWFLLSSLTFAAVSLWAIMPLHERLGTVVWLSLCLAAWAVAAACTWSGRSSGILSLTGHAAWALGSALAAIAMFAAARSVIREVRGSSRSGEIQTAEKPLKQQALAAQSPRSQPNDVGALVESATAENDDPDRNDQTAYVDGSEQESDLGMRHLSKAERKRLKKMARIKTAA